jgi:hypothetical protein
MKVQLTDKEISSYHLTVAIERDGEIYGAVISYDPYDGYEVTFTDSQGSPIATPNWVDEIDDETGSLGFYLEEMLNGRFEWTQEETANA